MTAAPKEDTSRSKRDPAGHRQALINAVLDLVAERGVPDATVSRIIERAGLSRGMIHLHFSGKDGLLIAAAQSFSESYAAAISEKLKTAGPAPADLVMAAIRADLSEDILTPRAARLWHGFRGISNPPPEIAYFCGTRGGQIKDAIETAFLTLAQETCTQDAARLAQDATFGTMALMEGMCADYLANLDTFSRTDAERVIRLFLAGLFPGRF